MRARRWGDNDIYLGPLTYAHDTKWRPFGVSLTSGDDEEPEDCSLRFSGFGHTVIFALPAIIRPYREKRFPEWDAATVQRLGRNWYWDMDRREFGFSISDGHLNIAFGRQSHDSSTERRWGVFLPWTQWRHVRTSLYDLAGEHFWTQIDSGKRGAGMAKYEERREAEERCPTATFAFLDFDGEALTATTRVDESERRFGTGWFKWLSLFRKPKVYRGLDIRFSGETGERKGSWKGGTIGHSISLLPGELHEAAFRRYCTAHNMTFVAA